MRAIQIEQFGDPAQVIRVVDIEEPPPPGPHEVLVSVEVSPLNKHDLLVVSGVLARPPLPHNTLTVTDIATGWTENRSARNKARKWVLAALDEIAKIMPFPTWV